MEEAQKILDDYFSTFPLVKEYIETCQQFVDEHGYIEDMVGRGRRFKFAGFIDHPDHYYEWVSRRDNMRKPMEQYARYVKGDRRAGTNHSIQALAAAMTKIGAINLYRAIRAEGLDAVIVEFIHDRTVVVFKPLDMLETPKGKITTEISEISISNSYKKNLACHVLN